MGSQESSLQHQESSLQHQESSLQRQESSLKRQESSREAQCWSLGQGVRAPSGCAVTTRVGIGATRDAIVSCPFHKPWVITADLIELIVAIVSRLRTALKLTSDIDISHSLFNALKQPTLVTHKIAGGRCFDTQFDLLLLQLLNLHTSRY